MATKMYVWRNGEKHYLTSKEVKSYIMKTNNWTAEEYRKKYDIFKNKLRAYESYQSAQGGKVEKQSVVDILFKEAKAKKQYGRDYEPSMKMRQIQSFKAYSITKGRAMAKKESYIERENLRYGEYVSGRFKDFIKENKGASEIVKSFEEKARQSGLPVNNVKLEKALSDYADKVNAKIGKNGKVENNEAIPAGETYGSDLVVDFDIDAYI